MLEGHLSLQNLQSLRHVHVQNNKVEGQHWMEYLILGCPHLTTLRCEGNNFTTIADIRSGPKTPVPILFSHCAVTIFFLRASPKQATPRAVPFIAHLREINLSGSMVWDVPEFLYAESRWTSCLEVV